MHLPAHACFVHVHARKTAQDRLTRWDASTAEAQFSVRRRLVSGY